MVLYELIYIYFFFEEQPYIVYMGNVPEEAGISAVKEHHSLLTTAIGE